MKMALRLRRDVQKASYYVWFLGAEEAKGLRGEHVINSVLPYLISRSRNMEPLKVTLQVSHKGIKIIQGSSKHLIPHSAITSALQTDDIVACVLLLYNPATKCPLHVHGYRCDSESTAEALNQQLQILINRAENQKRFEELETRLGILPPVLPTTNHKIITHNATKAQYPPPVQRHHETSPKRFSSSLGSDTGNSTRESECSEEHSGSSPLSRSPPHIATKSAVPIPSQLHNINHGNNELFDSLAAELRAKLNGNGPPLLLPPRDYDTVHRSKGNLTAIELRRCRNSMIVGGVTSKVLETAANGTAAVAQTATNANIKQVSSRGSSGIGSDLAPSPERQDLNTSSDEEQWSNEADSSVIALKPTQIPLERPTPLIARHVAQLQRKTAKMPPPEDSYLRDLPAKPYNARSSDRREVDKIIPTAKNNKSNLSWSKEDEIKPIIMRPTDYDAKFNRLIQAEREQKQQDQRAREPKIPAREHETERAFKKLNSTEKHNDINRLLHKKISSERDASPPPRDKRLELEDDSAESDPSLGEHISASVGYRKENMTDKQKFLEYSAKRNGAAKEIAHKYGARQRYIDPADLPLEKIAIGPNKYAAVHRSAATTVSEGHSIERHSRTPERARQHATLETERRGRSHEKTHAHSHERNPYREPESLPYIESMEKMYKSSALRFKPTHEAIDAPISKESNLRSHKSYVSADMEDGKSFSTLERGRHEYGKERYKEAKQKFSAMEEKYNNKSSAARRYADWSDEERLEVELTPPPSPIPHANVRSQSRSREQWERRDLRQECMLPNRHATAKPKTYMQDMRDYRSEHENYSRYHVKEDIAHARSRDEREREHMPRKERDYSPSMERNERRHYEKQRVAPMYSSEMYPPTATNGRNSEQPTSMISSKSLSNLNKGYRHSYAEPVFGRSAGRVGLAAVNPY